MRYFNSSIFNSISQPYSSTMQVEMEKSLGLIFSRVENKTPVLVSVQSALYFIYDDIFSFRL